jgi:pimeloyl-ACP methyl ester carboxylesterase
VLLGFSLGGSVAVRSAALDRRIAACIAVTPPYEPRTWIRYVNPIVRQQLMQLARDPNWVEELLDEFSLGEIVPKLRTPLLVFGAGRDLVVPPEESLHLSSAAGELATLVWYRRGSHGLYEHLDDWSNLAADWIVSMFPAGERLAGASTQVDEELPNVSPPRLEPTPPTVDALDDFEDDEEFL